MNYADMQAAIARDKFAKAKGRKAKEDPIVGPEEVRGARPSTAKHSSGGEGRGSRPAYRAEAEVGSGESYPLLARVDAETWLKDRLLAHGCDPYAGREYANYAERLGACIVRNGLACVIVGRNKEGRPETYAALFERVFSKSLPKLKAPRKGGGLSPTAGQGENVAQSGSGAATEAGMDTS